MLLYVWWRWWCVPQIVPKTLQRSIYYALCAVIIKSRIVYICQRKTASSEAHGAALVFQPPSLLKPLFFPKIHSLHTVGIHGTLYVSQAPPACVWFYKIHDKLCHVRSRSSFFSFLSVSAYLFCMPVSAGRSASCVVLWVSKLLYNS